MDAKPQKPLRGFRVHGDENAVPITTGFKTIHSRNKSSPALSTMAAKTAAQPGPLVQPIKRTAFGDVSNIANQKRTARDDMALYGKGSNVMKENIALQMPEKKSTAPLHRPAQRPMSLTSGLKGLLNNVRPGSSHAPKEASDVFLQNASSASNIVPNIKKAATRRNTVASKEPMAPSTTAVDDPSIPKQEQAEMKVVKAQQLMEPIPESSALGLPVVITAKGFDYAQPQPLQGSYSLHDAIYRVEPGLIHAPPKRSESIIEVLKDSVKVEGPVNHQKSDLIVRHDSNLPLEPLPSDLKDRSLIASKELLSQTLPATAATVPDADADENWEDEDEEDHLDDDGYVTARSFKSRGDNMTGNATTIIMPHMNARIKKELAAAKELVESMRTVEEIEDDHWDSTMVAEYSDEIFDYMRELERKMQPNPYYMDCQTEIQWSMRSVLMDWLVQVHSRFSLLPETLFLCANYIDRFLSCKVVSLNKLQLVGATAIFVAAKYEEINCPTVSEIAYMVDHGYTIEEILKAERFMLGMLQFEMGWPGPMSFLRRISKADDYDLETRTLAKYFLEITIMDERFLGCPPSFTAAGAHCLARMMLKKGPWSPHHVYYSNYTYGQLHSMVSLIMECCDNPTKHHAAVYDKYTDKRFKCASHFVRKELDDGFRLLDVNTNMEQTFMSFYAPGLASWALPPSRC